LFLLLIKQVNPKLEKYDLGFIYTHFPIEVYSIAIVPQVVKIRPAISNINFVLILLSINFLFFIY